MWRGNYKSMKSAKSSQTCHLRDFVFLLGIIVFYASVSVVLILLCTRQTTQEIDQRSIDIWEVIWDSIVSVISIVIAIADAITAFLLVKRRNIPRGMAIIFSLVVYILFVFNNVGIKYPLSRALIALVNFITTIVCICLYLINQVSQDKNQSVSTKSDNSLKKILGNTDNRKIIAIQMYNIKVSHYLSNNVERVKYIVKAGDYFIRNGYDINTISTITYDFEREIADRFSAILLSYQSFVNTGNEGLKDMLICSIDEQICLLRNRLKKIQEMKRNVTKEDCCLARVLIMYLSFKNILNPEAKDMNLRADYIGEVSLKEGDLEIDTSIEKKLFTFVRTGLLGAALLSERMRHVFVYQKEGAKQGRKYCASVLRSIPNEGIDDVHSDQNIDICLFTIDEKSYSAIPGYILTSIEKRETQILKALCE